MHSENPPIPFCVLLADDDVDDRLFFEKALKEIQMTTALKVVEDGDQLMNYLLQNTHKLPDVVFLDLSMPGKTGFECLSEIKESKELQDIPVIIFTTSFGRSSDFEQRLISTLTNIGSLEYIRKPGSMDELKQIVQRVLSMIAEKKSFKSTEGSS